MPSSTSNSELNPEFQTLEQSGRLWVALKTLIAGIIVFGLVVWVYQSLAGLTGVNESLLEQIESLPQLASQNKGKRKVMVLGSSMVEAGFDPEIFDTAMNSRGIDSLSYNYGSGNLNPEFQELITRHIRRSLVQENEKLSLTLVEFNPFQATKARNTFGVITRDQYQALLLSPDELWQITLEDPTRGIRLSNIRYLRGGLSAEMITALFTIMPKMIIAQSQSDNKLQWDLQRRIEQADILGLDFHETLVQAFIAMVKNLKQVSESIEVVLLPRNTDWVVYTPEVQAKLNALLRRIEKQTKVPVRNFQVHPRITPEHFDDTTHLSPEGMDIFTEILVEEYASKVQERAP